TKVESFTITLDDQNGGVITKQIDVTITGINDAATISGTATGAVTEDVTLSAGGTLTVSDVDNGQNHFLAPASLSGTYGAFTFDPNTGAWGYTLNNAAGNVQSLTAGEVVHDTLTVSSADSTASQVINVAITGSNDVPVIGGVHVGSVTEDVSVVADKISTSGALSIADVDQSQ